jgi:hypothetical protein
MLFFEHKWVDGCELDKFEATFFSLETFCTEKKSESDQMTMRSRWTSVLKIPKLSIAPLNVPFISAPQCARIPRLARPAIAARDENFPSTPIFIFEKKMKLFLFRISRKEERWSDERAREKSLIAMEKFTENRTKFAALDLHSMLSDGVGHSATLYHFLIHKSPLEIPAEKLFHNFTLRISLTTFAADVTLRFFIALRSLVVCALWDGSSATRHSRHLPCRVLILLR